MNNLQNYQYTQENPPEQNTEVFAVFGYSIHTIEFKPHDEFIQKLLKLGALFRQEKTGNYETHPGYLAAVMFLQNVPIPNIEPNVQGVREEETTMALRMIAELDLAFDYLMHDVKPAIERAKDITQHQPHPKTPIWPENLFLNFEATRHGVWGSYIKDEWSVKGSYLTSYEKPVWPHSTVSKIVVNPLGITFYFNEWTTPIYKSFESLLKQAPKSHIHHDTNQGT